MAAIDAKLNILEKIMLKKISVLFVLVLFWGESHAVGVDQAQPNKPKTDTEMTAEVKDIMRSVDEVKRLPVTGLSMVKAGERTFLITDNMSIS